MSRLGREAYPAVYTHAGAVTHLLSPLDSPNAEGYPIALCGLEPQWGRSWRGTGSQDEYDEARRRPLCARCEAAVLHEQGVTP